MKTTSSERSEWLVGLAIGLMTLIAVIVATINANAHFGAIGDQKPNRAADAAVGEVIADPALIDAPSPKHVPIVKGRFDRFRLDAAHGLGFVDDVSEPRSNVLRVRGWVGTPHGSLADHIVVVIDGTQRFEVTDKYGCARPDVAAALSNSGLTNSGVDVTIRPKLRPGKHSLIFAENSGSDRTLVEIEKPVDFVWK